MKKMFLNKNNVFYCIFSIALLSLAFLMKNEMLFLTIQVISLIVLWKKCLKSQVMLICLFFTTLYSIPPICYYVFHINMSSYTVLNNSLYFYKTLVVQTLFSSVLSIVIKKVKHEEQGIILSQADIVKNKSDLLFFIMIMFCVICIVLGKSGDTILFRGGYGISGSNNGSALYEYFYIFFLLAYIFSGKRKINITVLILMAFIYITKSLLYGGRIEVIQLFILIFILFFDNQISTKKMLLIMILGYLFMLLIGNFRSNLSFNFDSVLELLGYNIEKNRIISNEGDVFYSSTVILSSITNNIASQNYRIVSAVYWMIRLFVPSSFIPQIYNVVPYLQKVYTQCGGGGLYSSFIYFYFGYFGLIIIGIIISNLFNRISIKNNIYWKTFLILFITMLPRWYAYSSESFFKIPIYGVICLIVIKSMIKR